MASHQPLAPEEYNQQVSAVYKTTVILSFVTVFEVVIAFLYDHYIVEGMGSSRVPLMVFVTVASLVKAYYIMGVFMHAKHETKEFNLIILLPFIFIFWAIIAFLWEGGSWSYMREISPF